MTQVVSQLPCDGDGVCMLCKITPSDDAKLTCNTCVTPWHVTCLSVRPDTLSSALQWDCPDCTTLPENGGGGGGGGGGGENSELLAAIRAIEADSSLTERQKAKRRQEVVSGREADVDDDDDVEVKGKGKVVIDGGNDVMDIVDDSLKCSFCIHLPERPVTVYNNLLLCVCVCLCVCRLSFCMIFHCF